MFAAWWMGRVRARAAKGRQWCVIDGWNAPAQPIVIRLPQQYKYFYYKIEEANTVRDAAARSTIVR